MLSKAVTIGLEWKCSAGGEGKRAFVLEKRGHIHRL